MTEAEKVPILWDPLSALPAARRWLWAALAVLVCVVQGPAFLHTLRPARGVLVDYFRNWAAARFVLDGEPAYADQGRAVERYLGGRPGTRDSLFIERLTHPPVAVLAALPLATLDYRDATLIWNLFSLGCLAASLGLIARGLELRFTPWAVLPLVTLLLICHPLREELVNGQLNLVLLLLIVGAWTLERAGWPGAAGTFLGTATALKLFPGFLLVYFLARRQWTLLASAVACFALLTGLSVLVLGVDAYRTYFDVVVPHLEGCRGFAYNASLVGFWSKLFDPGAEHIVAWRQSAAVAQGAALACCLAVTAVVVWLARRARSRAASDAAFAAAVTAMLLATPTVWHHYFVLLALPLAVVWRGLPPTALARGLFLLIGVLFWFHPMLWWNAFVAKEFPGGYAGPRHVLTVLALQTYALLALFAMGIAATCKQLAHDEKAEIAR